MGGIAALLILRVKPPALTFSPAIAVIMNGSTTVSAFQAAIYELVNTHHTYIALNKNTKAAKPVTSAVSIHASSRAAEFLHDSASHTASTVQAMNMVDMPTLIMVSILLLLSGYKPPNKQVPKEHGAECSPHDHDCLKCC